MYNLCIQKSCQKIIESWIRKLAGFKEIEDKGKIFYCNTRLSKNVVAPVSNPPKMHYFRRIQHALGGIFEESKRHRFLVYGCDKHKQETTNDKVNMGKKRQPCLRAEALPLYKQVLKSRKN